jgi:hypothetical protein
MTKSEYEHEMMARKLWCDVFASKARHPDSCDDMCTHMANGAYERFHYDFKAIEISEP